MAIGKIITVAFAAINSTCRASLLCVNSTLGWASWKWASSSDNSCRIGTGATLTALASIDSGNAVDQKLWLHLVGIEGSRDETYSQDTGATQPALTSFTFTGTTGAGAASNTALRGGYNVGRTDQTGGSHDADIGTGRDHIHLLIVGIENAAARRLTLVGVG
jgi:hypothetical protein